ncbi:hypothetical protein HanRHA438_Chr05g0215231 [Helianthus annuus]|uniref:Uncharacterized protein n=1 Tax=Helianthus annuus TaxID=4232 RepID=A0A9K3NLU2_HELAN|nr:hypothetical protein HanXRQr2_Chr05g0205531 [Helianthus annuus]KAJ0918217.1 hypothetical protein HanRHA438_Chr05g0215231 [Helianthus annuus]KAJ0921997.1 hypothetical protein HanPSC8_Chr05g0198361 [Helianthus annuus]
MSNQRSNTAQRSGGGRARTGRLIQGWITGRARWVHLLSIMIVVVETTMKGKYGKKEDREKWLSWSCIVPWINRMQCL